MQRATSFRGRATPRRATHAIPAVVAACLLAAAARPPALAADPQADLRAAAAAYADAYNKRDYAALAGQWAERAELIEGDGRLVGRDAIVASIKRWLDGHPEARLAIAVTDVDVVAGPLARVRGTLAFTRKPGEKPAVTEFDSLRVLEDGGWRIVESRVAIPHAAALDDLAWLVGTWQATDAKDGTSVELKVERALGGHALVARTMIRTKQGPPLEVLDVMHADRATGTVRSWIFDSTGARAEGVVAADGTGFNRTYVGIPASTAAGTTAAWTQTVAPGGEGRFTLQSIERSLDGQPLPDRSPLHFKRK